MMLLVTLLRPYYRHHTRRARTNSRHLADWCDYQPAHRWVRWEIVLGDGRIFGQSCFTHLGALLIDAYREHDQVNLKRLERPDRAA